MAREDLLRLDPLEARMQLGVEHCRDGDWRLGLAYLGKAFEEGVPRLRRTGLAMSYLGYGIASTHGRLDEGRRLCEKALELEFYDPEIHLNMARLQLLLNARGPAVDALDRGLAMDPEHAGLLELRLELGERRSPPLPFLTRGNLINRILGRVRHSLVGDR